MSDKQLNSSQYNPHFWSKTSSTRSCQNLLCLTKRCNEDESKDKQRILNHQYFEKFSLKKFNNQTLINHSYYEKQSYYEKDKAYERSLKRDKSTEDSEFQNIIINPNKNEQMRYTGKNVNESKQYGQFEQSRRIGRCSSHRQLDKPMFNTTDRSISKQLEHDFRRIEDLQRLGNSLESQIRSLDQNIDMYYVIYKSKLQELKKIKSRMNEIGDGERLMKRIPSNDDLKGFKKKSFWEDFDGNKLTMNQKKYDNTNAYNNLRPSNNYKKHPSFYQPNHNMSFIKKAL